MYITYFTPEKLHNNFCTKILRGICFKDIVPFSLVITVNFYYKTILLASILNCFVSENVANIL